MIAAKIHAAPMRRSNTNISTSIAINMPVLTDEEQAKLKNSAEKLKSTLTEMT